MIINEFAAKLSGRQYGEEITREEEALAKEFGFVVVFGGSDDLMELRGAINDEIGCYEGDTIRLVDGKVFEGCSEENNDCQYLKDIIRRTKQIEAVWDAPGQGSWSYKTGIPHETFLVYEDSELYCTGIVFYIKDTFITGEWTPCNQGLPDPKDLTNITVLVTCKKINENTGNAYYYVTEARYNGFEWIKHGMCLDNVVAWRLMPSPYREN